MNCIVKWLHLKGLRRKWVLYMVNSRLVGTKEKNFERKRRLLNLLEEVEVGEKTRVVGPIDISGKVKIGNSSWIGKNFRVNGNGNVIIGDNCDIGPEVTFQTGGHEIGTSEQRAGKGINFTQIVGNGVWIGGRTTILNNTAIGNGSIVAGCACVTKNVPDNVIVGGVPARKIRDL